MVALAFPYLASAGFAYTTYYHTSSSYTWIRLALYIGVPIVAAAAGAITAGKRRAANRSAGSSGLVSEVVKDGLASACPGCGALNVAGAPKCAQCSRPLAAVAAVAASDEIKPFPRTKEELEAQPDPGPLRTITHDVVINGQVAFKQGELVQVEAVSPDPSRPQYRYVVNSRTMNQRFRLSDGDLSH